jgi:hypothetical protein
MIKNIVSLTLILFLIACNNSASNHEQANDTTEVEEPYVDPVKQEIVSAFPQTYQFFICKDSTFNINNFEQVSEDTINTSALKTSNGLRPYYPLFIYNADSSYAIDLYSNNVLLVQKKGKTVARHGGPDTEVMLIDLKNQTQKRIYFGGSSSAVLDAKWLDNQHFFLLTGEVISDTTFQPQIFKYNVADNTISGFDYKDTLNLKISDYRDPRLEGL